MRSRNNVAVSMNLSYRTAMLISEGEPRYASDPLPYFQRLDRAEYITWAFWLLISAGTSLGQRTVPQAPASPTGAGGRACFHSSARGLAASMADYGSVYGETGQYLPLQAGGFVLVKLRPTRLQREVLTCTSNRNAL